MKKHILSLVLSKKKFNTKKYLYIDEVPIYFQIYLEKVKQPTAIIKWL